MDDSTTREKVLKKIRAALLSKTANPYPRLDFDSPVFFKTDEDAVLGFADKFTAAGGKFFLVESELEFAEALVNLGIQYKWKNIFCAEEGLSNLLTECELPHEISTDHPETMDLAVTGCELLVIRTGSVVMSSKLQTRTLPSFAPVHVILASTEQLVGDIRDAILLLRQKYPKLPSGITFMTGTGFTSDIDGVKVNGGHGPQQVYLFLIDKRAY